MMFKTGVRVKLITTLMASLLVTGFTASAAMAVNEVSRLVPFQGRLHGTDNKAVSDGVYDLTFNIYDTPTGGTPSWSEAHTQVSVIHGYVNILLGAITPMHDTNYGEVTATPAYDPSKNNVDFTKKKFLGISINGGVEMFPRSQLVPSFHAYTANHADHATKADHALQADEASNAAKLNNQSASYYATVSGLGSSNSRITTVEGKFTGSKAKDADLLDGLSSGSYMRQENRNGYYGFTPNGNGSTWVRTPANGLLPYQSGTSGSLGTSSWNFSTIYGATLYESNQSLVTRYLGINAKAADANTLDGLNSTAYHQLVATGSSTSDPNTTTTGNILTKHANSPSTSYYWHIRTTFWSSLGANASQLATSYNAPDSRAYVRQKYNNVWKPWVRIDNNGKGVDSDKLDGLNSTDFLRNTAKAVDADKLDGISHEGFAKVDYGVPVGSIMIWAQTTAPAGWVICDGTALSRTTYSKLYSVLGTKYGTSSSTNFKVPNYKGYFLRGWGGSSAIAPDEASRVGGNVVGSTQEDELKAHSHEIPTYGDSGAAGHIARGDTGGLKKKSTYATDGKETRPVNIAVNYIIKL